MIWEDLLQRQQSAQSATAERGDTLKKDSGKLRWDLLPVRPMEEVVRVYTLGAAKYADNGWRAGMKFGRVFAAMMRHAWKWWRGEQYDETDGQHHLSSVVWCALTLMEYDLNPGQYGPLDDRVKETQAK